MTAPFRMDGTLDGEELSARDRALADAIRSINSEPRASVRRQMRKRLARTLGVDYRIAGNQSVGMLRRIAAAHFEATGQKIDRADALAAKNRRR